MLDVTLHSYSIPYSKVCGMAVGYQSGTTDAFASSQLINGPYVDGVSITYGTPRKHIWTYAIVFGSRDQLNGANNCPCSEFPGRLPSSFVQIHYYCESVNSLSDHVSGVLTDDPV